jgi:hypothetical protein
MGQIRRPLRHHTARKFVRAIGERWNHNLNPVLRQPPGELKSWSEIRGDTRQHLGRLIGIRNHHDPRNHRRLRLEQQSFPVNSVEDRPAHRIRDKAIRFGRHRRYYKTGDMLHLGIRQPGIHYSDHAGEPLAIRANRSLVRLRIGEVGLPEPRPCAR